MTSRNNKPAKSTPRTQSIGKHGENAAAEFLLARQYAIVETNWRCIGGEIDIVARNTDGIFVFVEVRTRQSTDSAFESVTPRKRERMIRAAFAYADAHPDAAENWRIDVIAVSFTTNKLQPTIEHIEDALDW